MYDINCKIIHNWFKDLLENIKKNSNQFFASVEFSYF